MAGGSGPGSLADHSPGFEETLGRANRRDESGRTLLHWLASLDDGETAMEGVRPVLQRFGDCPSILRERDWENGWSAAHRAVYMGNLRVLVELVRRDQDVLQSRDHEGLSPLDLYFLRYVDPLVGVAAQSSSCGREVWAWGNNADFQLGIPHATRAGDKRLRRLFIPRASTNASALPREPLVTFQAERDIVQIATAEQHTLFRTQDGRVFVAGFGANGRLGLGNGACILEHCSNDFSREPIRLPFSRLEPGLLSPPEWDQASIIQISAGGKQSAAITSSGMLFVWGADLWTPTLVTSLRREVMISVDMSETHAVALSKDRTVYWASADAPCKYRAVVHGPLGEGKTIAVAAGDAYRCAAIIRGHHHDEVLIWRAGLADLRRVRFHFLTSPVKESHGNDMPAPSERPANTSRTLRVQITRMRRFEDISAAGDLIAIRSESGDLYLIRDTNESTQEAEQSKVAATTTGEKSDEKKLWANLLQTNSHRSCRFQQVCCAKNICYAVDEMGCLWQWERQHSGQIQTRGRRVPHLRGLVAVAASDQHAFAIIEHRNPPVGFFDGDCYGWKPHCSEVARQDGSLPLSLSALCEQSMLPKVSLDTALSLLELSAYVSASFLRQHCCALLFSNLDVLLASFSERGFAFECFPMALMFLERAMKSFLAHRQGVYCHQTDRDHSLGRLQDNNSQKRLCFEGTLAALYTRYGFRALASDQAWSNQDVARNGMDRSLTDSKKSSFPGRQNHNRSSRRLAAHGNRVASQHKECRRIEDNQQTLYSSTDVSTAQSTTPHLTAHASHSRTPGTIAKRLEPNENHEDALNNIYTTVMLLPGASPKQSSEGTIPGRDAVRVSGRGSVDEVHSMHILPSNHRASSSRVYQKAQIPTWLQSSPLTFEEASTNQTSAKASPAHQKRPQSFRDLLRQETQESQKLSRTNRVPQSPATRAMGRAWHCEQTKESQKHLDQKPSARQQIMPSSPAVNLVSNVLPAVLMSPKTSPVSSWSHDHAEAVTEHAACPFRELLHQTERLHFDASRSSRVQPSPVWDRRRESAQRHRPLADIELEELQKAAELEEAAWLAEQLARIEAMEQAQSQAMCQTLPVDRSRHRSRPTVRGRHPS
jgi:hypothetical protein